MTLYNPEIDRDYLRAIGDIGFERLPTVRNDTFTASSFNLALQGVRSDTEDPLPIYQGEIFSVNRGDHVRRVGMVITPDEAYEADVVLVAIADDVLVNVGLGAAGAAVDDAGWDDIPWVAPVFDPAPAVGWLDVPLVVYEPPPPELVEPWDPDFYVDPALIYGPPNPADVYGPPNPADVYGPPNPDDVYGPPLPDYGLPPDDLQDYYDAMFDWW